MGVVLALSACNEEHEPAVDLNAINEQAQPPAEPVEPEPFTSAMIEKHRLTGAGCHFKRTNDGPIMVIAGDTRAQFLAERRTAVGEFGQRFCAVASRGLVEI